MNLSTGSGTGSVEGNGTVGKRGMFPGIRPPEIGGLRNRSGG